MLSRDRRSASRLRNSAITPAISIKSAPMLKAIAVLNGSPVSTILAKSSGPLIPPVAVPIAETKAMANAQVSSGKNSDTVKKDELTPAEEKNSAKKQKGASGIDDKRTAKKKQ